MERVDIPLAGCVLAAAQHAASCEGLSLSDWVEKAVLFRAVARVQEVPPDQYERSPDYLPGWPRNQVFDYEDLA